MHGWLRQRALVSLVSLVSVAATATAAVGAGVVQQTAIPGSEIPAWAIWGGSFVAGLVFISVVILRGVRIAYRSFDEIVKDRMAAYAEIQSKASEKIADDAKAGVCDGVQKAVKAVLNGPLESMVMGCPYPMWVKEAVREPSGNIRFVMRIVNHSYCRTFGVMRDQYVGNEDSAVWDHEVCRAYRATDMRVFQTEQPRKVMEPIGETLNGIRSKFIGSKVAIIKWPIRYGELTGIAGMIIPVAPVVCPGEEQ